MEINTTHTTKVELTPNEAQTLLSRFMDITAKAMSCYDGAVRMVIYPDGHIYFYYAYNSNSNPEQPRSLMWSNA